MIATAPETIGVGPAELADAAKMERAVLAACIRGAEAGGRAAEIAGEVLTPDDFGHHAHRAVFRAILDRHAAGEPTTAAVLHLALKRSGDLADLGADPVLWFVDLLDDFPSTVDVYVRQYAGKVADLAGRRRLRHGLTAGLRELDAPGTLADVRASVERHVFAASDPGGRGGDGPRPAADMVPAALTRIDDMAGGGFAGVPTGFPELDHYVSGLRPGQVWIVAARPAVGKTSLALGIALAAAGGGVPTLFHSLEMAEGELMTRALAMRSGVPLWCIDQGRLTGDQAGRVCDAGHALAAEPFHLDANPHLTPARFASELRRAVRRHGIKLAVIDYLQLMTPTNPRENRNQQVGEAARAVKLAAGACGVPVLLLSQLNRESEHRDGGRPRLADLRDSGEIEQHAHGCLLLHPQAAAAGEASRLVDVIVAKNRSGPEGEVTLRYTGSVVRFDTPPK